jgi:hypothetical protein
VIWPHLGVRGIQLRKFVSGLGLSVVFFAINTPAYAYLDPGTGSIILQGLIAGIAAFGTIISINYHRLKAKFREIFGKGDGDKAMK